MDWLIESVGNLKSQWSHAFIIIGTKLDMEDTLTLNDSWASIQIDISIRMVVSGLHFTFNNDLVVLVYQLGVGPFVVP